MTFLLTAGQIMWKLLKLHVGSTAHGLFMDGVMLGLYRSRLQGGLLLFLYLNPTGKYAWPEDFQQALTILASGYNCFGTFNLMLVMILLFYFTTSCLIKSMIFVNCSCSLYIIISCFLQFSFLPPSK